MVLEELVDERHEVSLHGIGYLEVVCLDRGHHVLNHLDDFSAESHCSLVCLLIVNNKNTCFIDLLSICHLILGYLTTDTIALSSNPYRNKYNINLN